MSYAMEQMPLLQGFIVALVVPASANCSPDRQYCSPFLLQEARLPAFEACVLSYRRDEFENFRGRAAIAQRLEDWEFETSNFLVSTPFIHNCTSFHRFHRDSFPGTPPMGCVQTQLMVPTLCGHAFTLSLKPMQALSRRRAPSNLFTKYPAPPRRTGRSM